MNMMLLRALLLIVILVLTSFLVGQLYFLFFRKNQEYFWKVCMWGFICIIGFFEILTLPLIIIQARFTSIIYVACIGYGILFFLAIFAIVIKKPYKRFYRIRLSGLTWFTIALIFFVTIYISYFSIDAGDDGCYIAISNCAIEQNQVVLNDISAYDGNSYFESVNYRPMVSSWELWIAFVCKLFAIHPAIFAHSFLPLFLIPICYLIIYEIAIKIFGDTLEAKWCLIFYVLLTLFYGNYLPGLIWVGKALMFFFVFPALFSMAIDIYQEKEQKETWPTIFLIMIAGCATSATGTYMMPFYYISLGLPYLVYNVYRRAWKRLKKILWNSLLSLSGIAFIDAYILIYISRISVMFDELRIQGWQESFWWNCYSYMIVFVFLTLILMLFTEIAIEWKLLFCGSAAVTILIFINPLFFDLIRKITTEWLYWRLNYLYSGYIVVSVGAVWLVEKVYKSLQTRLSKRKPEIIRQGFFCFELIVLCCAIISSKTNIFRFYQPHNNWYMIPTSALDLAIYLEMQEKNSYTILLPSDILCYIRQYSSYANVIGAKYGDTYKLILAGNAEEENQIMQKYISLRKEAYEHNSLMSPEAREGLDYFNVDYVVTESNFENREGDFMFQIRIGKYYIYGRR